MQNKNSASKKDLSKDKEGGDAHITFMEDDNS